MRISTTTFPYHPQPRADLCAAANSQSYVEETAVLTVGMNALSAIDEGGQ